MGHRAVPSNSELAAERLLRQARMHAALGEPVRLAMIRRLLITDASPGELGAAYGLATNVLAHHLKVLQTAGLVRRVKSEGDARRSYIQLLREDPEVMAMVDPRPGSAAEAVLRSLLGTGRPQRVVFVCTANSARSQLAEATWRQVSHLPVTSAGTRPAPRVHPRALATGRRHGLRFDGARTARLVDVAAPGDLVVCVCDNAHEELTATSHDPLDTPMVGQVHWAVPDPVHAATDEAFDSAYTEIAGHVQRLAESLDPAPSTC